MPFQVPLRWEECPEELLLLDRNWKRYGVRRCTWLWPSRFADTDSSFRIRLVGIVEWVKRSSCGKPVAWRIRWTSSSPRKRRRDRRSGKDRRAGLLFALALAPTSLGSFLPYEVIVAPREAGIH